MWYFTFKLLRKKDNAVAYQLGPLFFGREWGYDGVGICVVPTLFLRVGFKKRRYLFPALLISAAIGFCTITIRIGKPMYLWYYGQQKDQVKRYEYNGYMTANLPGFAKWRVKEVIGWTNDPGVIKIKGTDGNDHLVPVHCLSDELLTQLPPKPAVNSFEGNGQLFGTPSNSH